MNLKNLIKAKRKSLGRQDEEKRGSLPRKETGKRVLQPAKKIDLKSVHSVIDRKAINSEFVKSSGIDSDTFVLVKEPKFKPPVNDINVLNKEQMNK